MATSLTIELGGAPRAAKVVIMQWLFGQVTYNQLIASFEEPAYGRELVKIAQESGYINKCCKLFAYYHYYYKEAKPADFDIAKQDVHLLKNLGLQFPSKVNMKPMTLRQFDRTTERMLYSRHMVAHVGKLINKKLRWLYTFGYDFDELQSMLIIKALYGLAKQYPYFESALHFQNVAKRVIHNEAMSLITMHTRGKRKRLVQNPDGTISSLMAPLEAIKELQATERFDTQTRDSLTSIVQLSPAMSLEIQRFLKCMCGQPCPKFSAYLGMDNSDAVDSMRYDVYRSKLEAHLGVTRVQTDRILGKLRQHLV